ncbi:unnamed protein product, partial [Brenthis ino]
MLTVNILEHSLTSPIPATAANLNEISQLRRRYYSAQVYAQTQVHSIPITLILRWDDHSTRPGVGQFRRHTRQDEDADLHLLIQLTAASIFTMLTSRELLPLPACDRPAAAASVPKPVCVTYTVCVTSTNSLCCPSPMLCRTCPDPMLRAPSPMLPCPSPMLPCSSPMLPCPSPMLPCPSPMLSCPNPMLSCPSPMLSCPSPMLSCSRTMLSCPSPMLPCPSAMLPCSSPMLPCPSPMLPRTCLCLCMLRGPCPGSAIMFIVIPIGNC